MRIVLDTNVLVSAFTATGVCHQLYEQALLTQELVTSGALIAEFRGTLQKKFKYSDEEVSEASATAARDAMIVATEPLAERICRDRDDDDVLATAVAGKADCIITGDNDLLTLKKFGGIRIRSPRQFLELLDRPS